MYKNKDVHFFLEELEFHGLSRVLTQQTENVRRKLSIPNDHFFGWKNSTVPGTKGFCGSFAVLSNQHWLISLLSLAEQNHKDG